MRAPRPMRRASSRGTSSSSTGGAVRPWGLALWILLTHRLVLGLVNLELSMAIIGIRVLELEHLTGPVMLEEDDLHRAHRRHRREGCAQFLNGHGMSSGIMARVHH